MSEYEKALEAGMPEESAVPPRGGAASLTIEERLAALEEAVTFLRAENRKLESMIYAVGRTR